MPDSLTSFLRRFRSGLLFTFFLALPALLTGPLTTAVWSAEEEKPAPGKVEAVADQLEYDRGGKRIIGKGNVVVTYGDTKLTADYAEVETDTKKAYARGHVIILRSEKVAARGEEAYYDFLNHQGRFPNGQSVDGPWFAEGKEVRQVSENKIEIEDAGITTCDRERPHYQIRAKKVSVFRGDKIFARNVTVNILGKPVFWWPYAVIPLQEKRESPIQIQPGYSSQYGGYILTSKGFSVTKWLWGRWNIDWRSKRGFGGGADFDYHFDRFKTDGRIQTYLTQDHDSPTPGLRPNPYDQREDRTRGRVTWKHRTDFNPDTHVILRFNNMSDEFFLQDFFEKEFRSDVEPTSFATFTHNSDRYGFYIFNQKQIRSFETVTERLPEVRFDWKNAPFFTDRLYYESNTSFANLNQTFSRSELDYDTVRFDTFHEWTLPLRWRGFKLTPLANIRETLYTRDRWNSDPIARIAFGGAADLRTHFYRVFNVNADFLGIEINQLRHVFEPSFRYDSTVHSSVSSEDLQEFDSVDAVDDRNRFTFGLENRIQTKRIVNGKMQRVDLVSLNTFLSYDFHPDGEYRRSGFSLLYGDLQIRPYDWFQFEIRYEYDMIRDSFREFNQDLIAKHRRFRFLFGHRYLGKNRFLDSDSAHQFVFDVSVWLNERWKVGGYVRWDAEDHELEEWQVSATRDLHDFLLDFGYNVRNSDIDESNKELFFLLRLKAFPDYPLKSGNRASFSEPRIGTTVAGANQAKGAAATVEGY
jgi:lipopolysaccharide assembly outer membrane protein LptD (OstA)